jgi:hypothetical protein
MRVGVHRRGLHGAGKSFHGVGRPLGFQVAHAELAPGVGIRRVFHHYLFQQADGGGKIRLSERLEGAREPIFGFKFRHSRFHSLGTKFETGNSKLETGNRKLEIRTIFEFCVSPIFSRFLGAQNSNPEPRNLAPFSSFKFPVSNFVLSLSAVIG